MEVLKVEGVAKSFGGLQVLQGISFTAEAGEKLAIIGPNGEKIINMPYISAMASNRIGITGIILIMHNKILKFDKRC